MRHPLFAFASTLVLGLVGCVADEAEDGINDSFIGNGKSDAFGVAEDSPDAIGVLSVLQIASLEELDNQVGLSSNTAKAIIHHRQGGDRKDRTADDDLIDSLTELDAIPYVGPMAFRLLLDHARAEGAVPSSDPFDPNFCGWDYAMTNGVHRYFLPEGTPAALVPTTLGGIRVRTRVCVTPDNCPAWVPGSVPDMFVLEGEQTPTQVKIPAMGV